MQIPRQGLGREFFLAQVFNAILLVCLASVAALGQSVLPGDIYSFRGNVGANATAEPIAVSGQSFTQGYRVTVGGTSAKVDDAGLLFRTAQAVGQGDNLQLIFWVRKVAPLDGNNIRGFVGFEKIDASATKSLYTTFPCDGATWTKYSIPFKAAASYAAGEAQVAFHFTGRRLLNLAASVWSVWGEFRLSLSNRFLFCLQTFTAVFSATSIRKSEEQRRWSASTGKAFSRQFNFQPMAIPTRFIVRRWGGIRLRR